MEDKTMRLIVESSDKGETCNIMIENASPTSAIYMATKLVTAVAKQFSKSEKHVPLHDQCRNSTIELKSDKQDISPTHLS